MGRRVLLIVAALGGGCVSPLTGMVHPVTGETRTCVSHLPPGFASLEMDRCVDKLKTSGFVPAEELTAEERAALQARTGGRVRSRTPGPAGAEEADAREVPADPSGDARGIWRQVTMVPDAETAVLDGGQRIRYLGIQRVESPQAPSAIARFGDAVAYSRQLIQGKRVRLEFDTRVHDPEGFLWAYVYLLDGRMVNALLVEQGYAQADRHQPDLKHAQLFQQLETEARNSGRGHWGGR